MPLACREALSFFLSLPCGVLRFTRIFDRFRFCCLVKRFASWGIFVLLVVFVSFFSVVCFGRDGSSEDYGEGHDRRCWLV